ncbi:MAG: serine/threonine-protein kinase [Gemmatimonadaceae bacterium]
MTAFTPDEWATLSALLDSALDLPPESRAAWLAEQRIAHPALAPELEALLGREARIEQDGFMSESPASELPRLFSLTGQTLGPWVLERPLGQGGMGSVWLARRNDRRFDGVAAIKFLSLAVAGPEGEARFRREGSLLARLTHPNIARLLDAGVSPTGLPYLVLEYIDGAPIDEWCDARALPIDARLRLFQQVLAAVAHAHANFIVHRDLKPANILVTADGTVKLLDFGIAKLLDDGGESTSALTGTQQSVFTLKFAAPEQIRSEPITTATDVYSLGVVLYELLAGRHPTGGNSRTPAEHVVAILNTDAVTLSRAVTAGGTLTPDEATRLAAARDASPEKLRRALAGDLDNIVGKALKKLPAERYATVGALSDDLQRHLEHLPISARADSLRYRAGKFVRRNRAGVALAALALIGLVGAAARERQLRGRAELEARKAVAVEEYLVSIFGAADPYASSADKPNDITARALLDRGADRLDTALSAQPEVRAELRGALGRVYANLGIFGKANSELRHSLAERRELFGTENADVAEAMDRLGEVLSKEDSLDQADTLLRAGLAIRRKLLGNHSDATAESLEHLADLLTNRDKFDDAEPLYREALAIRRELHGDDDLTVAASRNSLASLLQAKGQHAAAVTEFRQALAIRQHVLGVNHPATAQTLQDLAGSEERLGDYKEAERDYREAMRIERKTLGPDSRDLSMVLNNLGQMLFKLGRLDEADAMLREALAINRKKFGENHDAVSANLANLALIVRERGGLADAQRLLEEALAIDRTLYGKEHIDVGFDLNEIAVVMRLRGKPDSAVTLLRQSLAMNHRIAGDNLGSLTISVNLGRALQEAGHNAEAERMLRGALAKLDSNNAEHQLSIIPGRIGLGRVLLATNRASEARPVLKSVVAMSRTRQGVDHWRTAESQIVLGKCLLALGDVKDAEEPVRKASAVLSKLSKSHPGLAAEADTVSANLARRMASVR